MEKYNNGSKEIDLPSKVQTRIQDVRANSKSVEIDLSTTHLSSLTVLLKPNQEINIVQRIEKESSVAIEFDVTYSPDYNLTVADVFDDDTKLPNLKVLEKHFLKDGDLEVETALRIINTVVPILRTEKNVVEVNGPTTVCADTLDEFHKMIQLFEYNGSPANRNYIFLGNYYVSTGIIRIQCSLYLWAIKICYPNNVFLLRGFQERQCLLEPNDYEFDHSKTDHSKKIYNAIKDVFYDVPLAAIMDKKFLCLYSGISPEIRNLEDINKIDRFTKYSMYESLPDLANESLNYKLPLASFYNISESEFCDFLSSNQLHSIITGGSLMYGNKCYEIHGLRYNGFPALITIADSSWPINPKFNIEAAFLNYERRTRDVLNDKKIIQVDLFFKTILRRCESTKDEKHQNNGNETTAGTMSKKNITVVLHPCIGMSTTETSEFHFIELPEMVENL